jgi:alkanesulfonate monooxygenase SsuD/methylene tetrahydromethanopterin reductase-like flavin-dependent oxidoreductase (luciferase family)
VTSPLGVALSGHYLSLPSVLRLARRADALGYEVLFVDGDTAVVPGRPDAPIYDGPTLAGATLASTNRAKVASIRLPFYWNPVLLARALATSQEASGGRALGFFGVGSRGVSRIGLPDRSPAERLAWLEEVLDSLGPLLAGEVVTRGGRYVEIDRVRIPAAAPPPPIVLAAAGRRALELVDRYADVWEANVPPLRERLEPRRERLKRTIETWVWVFARPGLPFERAAGAYRQHSPWFSDIPDSELPRALLYGEADRCRERLEAMHGELSVGRLVLDLTGLDEAGALGALEALAPAKGGPIS